MRLNSKFRWPQDRLSYRREVKEKHVSTMLEEKESMERLFSQVKASVKST